jgi:hypothetical protein
MHPEWNVGPSCSRASFGADIGVPRHDAPVQILYQLYGTGQIPF